MDPSGHFIEWIVAGIVAAVKAVAAFAAAHPIISGVIAGAIIGMSDAAINGRSIGAGAAFGAVGGALGGLIVGPGINAVGGFIHNAIGPAILRVTAAGWGIYQDIRSHSWISLGVTSLGAFGDLNTIENELSGTNKLTNEAFGDLEELGYLETDEDGNLTNLKEIGVDKYQFKNSVPGGYYSYSEQNGFKAIFTQKGLHFKNQRYGLVHFTGDKVSGKLAFGFHVDAYDAFQATGIIGHGVDVIQGLITNQNVSPRNSILFKASNDKSVKNFMSRPRL